jgi:hypothetical protein
MLQIRSEQMQSLSEQLLKKFEDRLVAHLHEVFPKRCAALGEEKVRALVKDGTQRAQKYNVVAERDVAMFVDLMMVVRPDFDVARETPWAKVVCNDTALSGPQKVTRLFIEARRNRFRITDEVPAPPATQAPASAMPGTGQPGPSTAIPGARPVSPSQTAPRPPAVTPRPPSQQQQPSTTPGTTPQPQTPVRRPPPRSFGAVPPL